MNHENYKKLKNLSYENYVQAIKTAQSVIANLQDISDDSKLMIEKTFVNYTLQLIENGN